MEAKDEVMEAGEEMRRGEMEEGETSNIADG